MERAGVYGINQGGLGLVSSNYTLNYQGNNLTITKALLNVIADAKTKVYGDADPSLTYQVSGLKNGDTAGAVLNGGSLSRVAGENVGVYGINQGGLGLVSAAVTWPIGLPLPSVRITVAPASAVPAITLPLLGSITGAAGASESTVALVGLLLLPAASWASALITVPLANGVAGVKAQLPLPSAVTWPIGLPLPSACRVPARPASM